MKKLIFSLIVFGLCSMAHADIDPGSVSILRFSEVVPGVYRGARPSDQDLTTLSLQGLKTDIDLEDDDDVVAAEGNLAKTLHLSFVSDAMSGFWEPSDVTMFAVQSALNDPTQFPLFIHCQHGEDRTGLMVGLYRVFTLKWSVDQAYQEMLANGFHPTLLGLQHYWDEKTEGLK